ncbi:hypothetical protein HDU97_005886 [Phlyctochytrium planicorne]|nr:hypothetical protein HDU97_005886 [Phlyctochytrium planicorne]
MKLYRMTREQFWILSAYQIVLGLLVPRISRMTSSLRNWFRRDYTKKVAPTPSKVAIDESVYLAVDDKVKINVDGQEFRTDMMLAQLKGRNEDGDDDESASVEGGQHQGSQTSLQIYSDKDSCLIPPQNQNRCRAGSVKTIDAAKSKVASAVDLALEIVEKSYVFARNDYTFSNYSSTMASAGFIILFSDSYLKADTGYKEMKGILLAMVIYLASQIACEIAVTSVETRFFGIS